MHLTPNGFVMSLLKMLTYSLYTAILRLPRALLLGRRRIASRLALGRNLLISGKINLFRS
jgi:hypothetical protein